ncbi:cysteine desulfurase NifS [uncultured Desulfuromonas sp.]|uniref:cysteine desulfurase NifS n=2 Tax=Desulfuromonas TaxID=890 RepID=UPI00263A188C|nr:cysteine desulfurase NifS [uncultured Desulfuromonas sp.]
MKTIYVDNNATTAVAPEVLEVMQPYLTAEYFNPSSMYEAARSPAEAIARARATVARCLGGVDPEQILFTGSATESNNTALFGTVQANPEKRHIVTTAVEHPSVLEVAKELARRGQDVTFLPVNRQGELPMEEYVRALRKETLIVSIMMANNETGVIYPVAELARIAKETSAEIVFHTDATQAIGKIPVDLKTDLRHVDLLSFSGHKIHAPKGVGAVFVRRGTRWRPFMIGGHQERGRRAGTENVPYIVGLAKACELAVATVEEEQTRVRALRDRLQSTLVAKIPALEINGREAERLPNTLNLALHGVEGEAILYELSRQGICASSGSACTSGSLDPSHVLQAMEVPFTAIHGSLRISLSRYTEEAEVERIIEVLPPIVASLRRLSPFWDDKRNCLKV